MNQKRDETFEIRQSIVGNLIHRPTFFPSKEVMWFAEKLLHFFESEDTHLEKVGLPSNQFDYWYSPFAQWQNLCFTKIPYTSVLAGKVPSKLWREAIEKRDHGIAKKHIDDIKSRADTAYIWKNWPPSKLSDHPEFDRDEKLTKTRLSNGFSRFEYWSNTNGELFDKRGREVRSVSYAEAKRVDWLTLAQEKRIQASRQNLLQAKIVILKHISDFLVKGVPENDDDKKLRKKLGKEFFELCAHTLTETVTPEEVRFLLNIECEYHENGLFNFGGLLPVLRTIIHISGGPLGEYQWITSQLEEFRWDTENSFEFPMYWYREIPDHLFLEIFNQSKTYKSKLSELTFSTSTILEKLIIASIRDKARGSKKKPKTKHLIQKQIDFKWSKVRLTLVEANTLLINYDGKENLYSHEQIGLCDGRGKQKKRNQAWSVLAKILVSKGRIPTETRSKIERGSLRQQMIKIRDALKTLFKTTADPFESNAKITGVYQAKFLTGLGVADQISDMFKEAEEDERSSFDEAMDDDHENTMSKQNPW